MSPACVPRDYGLAGASVRNDKSGWFGEFIGCDLERVTVGIAKINGVRNLVILKFEFDSAFFEFALRCKEVLSGCAKSEMKHSKIAVTRGSRLCVRTSGE